MGLQLTNGYFAETGDASQDILGVGGWLSTYDLWITFEPKWRAVLPSGESDFHDADFWARQDYGADWSEEQRGQVVRHLGQVAQTYALCGVGIAISREEYQYYLTPVQQGALKDPLYFCFEACMSILLHFYKSIPSAPPFPIRCMFDAKDKRGRLGAMFDQIKQYREWDKVIDDLSFGRRCQEHALQAADLLVGELRRHREGHPSELLDSMTSSNREHQTRFLFSFPRGEQLKEIAQRVLDNRTLAPMGLQSARQNGSVMVTGGNGARSS
jgi:hypothetical protein